MRIVIATVRVPFIDGGAEILAEGLRHALMCAGHEAEIVALPFKWYPPEKILDHMLACRLIDLTESCGVKIDKIIALKFPAYLVEHPSKTIWLLHQHRTAYDLWDSSHGDLLHQAVGGEVRAAIHQADRAGISKVGSIFTISRNVSRRLKEFCGIDSTPLYHPPEEADKFSCAAGQEYLFFPSRISEIKRQALALEALTKTRRPVRMVFSGVPDHPPYLEELKKLAVQLRVHDRVEWRGIVEHRQLRELYASALGVVFVPLDEDYGYVTLEAMLASKPVITCTDSGGPLEFVLDNTTGLIAAPNPEALAEAMDALWQDRPLGRRLGKAGRERYNDLRISWDDVVEKLTE